uniref:CHHC U11-48K-type domain-containing protein n=1 Tax=Plectus sambesii TaxID=2011161 RepID=A0A914V3S9_9BILA
MSSVGAWDWMRSLIIGCPYKCGLTASAFDIDHHVVNCRQLWMQNGGRDLKICPYNRQHHVPLPEYQYHLERCGGGATAVLSAAKSAEGAKSKLNVNAPVFTPRSSSNGSSCSLGGTTTNGSAAFLPLTEHVPKSDPQYLPHGTTVRDTGGYSAVDQWLNAQCARQGSVEPHPTSVGGVPSSTDDSTWRQNYQNYELFELFPKRRPLVASLEDLIDLECSHAEEQQQQGGAVRSTMCGFQSMSSSSSGCASQPQSERASPDSDTAPPIHMSGFDHITPASFIAPNNPIKPQLPGVQSLAETLEAWNKQQAMNNGGQFEIRNAATTGAQWSSWSSGVGEHLLTKGWTGF